MQKILVVDDEQDLCEILQFNIENEGYKVETANSAEEALTLLKPEHCLILLDVMMGGMSGYQLAHKLRDELHVSTPIIFLTAKNTENDMLTGFSIGGDDYIAKPFSIKEVIARIKAVLKRSEIAQNVSDSNIHIDKLSKTISLNGKELELTKKEYQILELLVEHKGQYFSREEIMNRVWDDKTYVLERAVDVHIARLRKKLGSMAENLYNKIGFGYIWKD